MIEWINRDLWGPIWPNLAASALCTGLAVVRIHIHLARHREAMARQHADQHEKTRRLIAELQDRIDLIGPRKEVR